MELSKSTPAEESLKRQFQKIEDRFNEAVASNDVARIKACVTDDWVLVDPQGGVIPQERFFTAVASGNLVHKTMTKEIVRVKVYGDTAIVTGRCKNTGSWQGQLMEADEWVTDVYIRQGDDWKCVLTHLTPVKS